MKITHLLTLAAFAVALPLGAQVVINDTFIDTYVPGVFASPESDTTGVTSFSIPLSDLTTAGFAASGSDKLVLAISTKWQSVFGGVATSITYNTTQSFVEAVGQKASRAQTQIFYLDDVTSDGNIDITFDSITEGFAIRLFALDGTAAGVTDTGAKLQTSDGVLPTLTSPAGAFVFWDASLHRRSATIDDGDFTASQLSFGGRGNSNAFWNVEATGGTFNGTISDDRTDGAFVGATFAAVPEPSAFALLAGMFGLTWVMLRRRES